VCGERVLAGDEYSARRLLTDTFRDVTSLDARLYRSLWLLVRRPGYLTVEFLRGRRVPYLRPVQLFLLANLVYFVVQPRTGFMGYNTTLVGQTDWQFYSRALDLRARVERRVAERGDTFQAYQASFDARSHIYARSLVGVLVPVFAVGAAVVLWQRRRAFATHLVFAAHLIAWQLLVVMSVWLALLSALSNTLRAFFGWVAQMGIALGFLETALFEFSGILILAPYLYLSLRAVHGTSRLASTALTLLLTAFFMVAILFYRLLLFWITFATV
jgi:hypothetical protein